MALQYTLSICLLLLVNCCSASQNPAALLQRADGARTTSLATIASMCPAPKTKYESFHYTQVSSNRYATPLPSPVTLSTGFAPPFTRASKHLPKNVTTTMYSLNREATSTSDGAYGQSAYAMLWASTTFAPTLPFTTTVAPTPVASSELIYPPPLYSACSSADACLDCYKLPENFIWGVSSSAYQIEGGLYFGGRGPAATDALSVYFPNASANVVNMNYFLFKPDIVRLAAIGIPYLSFSISWTRVVPFGFANTPINAEAIMHYDTLINTCLENGIKPIVTLCHYDRPASVPADSPDFRPAFFYYATQVMAHFGDRVPIWITFNEPNLPQSFYYATPNGITNVLLAHAQVYRWYKNTLGGTGRISMKWANNLAVPSKLNNEDIAASVRWQDFYVGLWGNPLFLGQQYPTSALGTPGYNLTALTKAQIKYINGTMDFLSFDPYVAQVTTAAPSGIAACAADPTNPNWPSCAVFTESQANGWLIGQASNGYTYIDPQYVRQQIKYQWDTWKPAGILIAEFGFDVYGEALRSFDAQRYDLERTLYYQQFLREMLKSIYEDHTNVIGTLAWTYADDTEFVSLTDQYGMQTVNRTSGKFERHYKRSMFDYVDFFHSHVL